MILVMVYVLCVYLWKMDSFNLLGNKINYYLSQIICRYEYSINYLIRYNYFD